MKLVNSATGTKKGDTGGVGSGKRLPNHKDNQPAAPVNNEIIADKRFDLVTDVGFS
jgi:hypothetical protein